MKTAALHGEAVEQHDRLKRELGEKSAFIEDLQKKLANELDELKKEKERAAANVESLRSKLYGSTKECKDQTS